MLHPNPLPTILIAEDEQGLRVLLEKSLQKQSRRIILASDGHEALLLFSKHPIDLVILDVMMPGMNGLEACAELRKLSRVPIIMLSAFSSPATEAHALHLGACAFLRKPISLANLQSCVLSLHHQHRHNQPSGSPLSGSPPMHGRFACWAFYHNGTGLRRDHATLPR